MREVELRVGSESMPDQEIIIEVMNLLMDNMEVAVKGKVSMLERRDLTKKGAYFISFFCGVINGYQGVHYGCSRIAAPHWERKGDPPGSSGNISDG